MSNKWCIGSILGALLAFLAAFQTSLTRTGIDTAMAEPLTPTPDRLAEPPLPANPTQYERGRYLYWLNCMACHGDRGQGLTDEFRSLWVDDHQNCWARGCHGGGPDDQGFPLPPTVPVIISSPGDLPRYARAEELFEYLRTTHPPQHPGDLSEDEYWAITAYVMAENKRLPTGRMIGPQAATTAPGKILRLSVICLALLIVSGIIFWSLGRHKNHISSR